MFNQRADFVAFAASINEVMAAGENRNAQTQWEHEQNDAIFNNGIRRGYNLCGGYTSQYDMDIPQSKDWRFKYIGTQGCGNRGELAMIPCSARAHHARTVGNVVSLVRNYGLSTEHGILFNEARRSARVSYGFEPEVIRLALLIASKFSWTDLEIAGEWCGNMSHARWVAKNGLPPQGELSVWRYQSALAIAKAYLELM